MTTRHLIRAVLAGISVAGLLAVAVPAAAAQAGSLGRLSGRIVDEKGQPVPDAQVLIEAVGGDQSYRYNVKSDSRGSWAHAGVYAGSGAGSYSITVTKGELSGEFRGIIAKGGILTPVPDIIMAKGAISGGASGASKMTAAEITEFNRKQEETKRLYESVNTDIDAKNYDSAITKLEGIIKERDKCGSCYSILGSVYLKKGDLENSEKAHQQAIQIDPKQVSSYEDLASIYNRQKKFDEAGKMTKTAMEINAQTAGSAGAAGGGVTGGSDPKSFYNQGVILWNQGKAEEAAAQFQRAVDLDPKYANAQYHLGLTLYSSGKSAAAKKPLEEYMKTGPSGENANLAKLMLQDINKTVK